MAKFSLKYLFLHTERHQLEKWCFEVLTLCLQWNREELIFFFFWIFLILTNFDFWFCLVGDLEDIHVLWARYLNLNLKVSIWNNYLHIYFELRSLQLNKKWIIFTCTHQKIDDKFNFCSNLVYFNLISLRMQIGPFCTWLFNIIVTKLLYAWCIHRRKNNLDQSCLKIILNYLLLFCLSARGRSLLWWHSNVCALHRHLLNTTRTGVCALMEHGPVSLWKTDTTENRRHKSLISLPSNLTWLIS